LQMVHLQDANHSLIPLWIRPLLNLRAGLTVRISAEASSTGWPENLRIMLQLSSSEMALPVPDELINACGGVLLEHAHGPQVGAGQIPAGGSFDWLHWASSIRPTALEAWRVDPLVAGHAPYHLCATSDMRRVELLAELHGESPEFGLRLADAIRRNWPRELLRQPGP
jgi:hypothetical protein